MIKELAEDDDIGLIDMDRSPKVGCPRRKRPVRVGCFQCICPGIAGGLNKALSSAYAVVDVFQLT